MGGLCLAVALRWVLFVGGLNDTAMCMVRRGVNIRLVILTHCGLCMREREERQTSVSEWLSEREREGERQMARMAGGH